jgi:predicted transcriptional regulator
MFESDASLKNETRKLIYNHIKSHPGVSFNILKSVLKINESTLRYHLNYLERSDKISLGSENGRRYYFPYPGKTYVIPKAEEPNSLSPYKLSSTQEKIILAIQRNPKINQKDLVNITKINRITLSKNLKQLMDMCLVRKIPNGNSVNYEFLENKQLRYEILKRLIRKLLNNEIDEETFLRLKRELD